MTLPSVVTATAAAVRSAVNAPILRSYQTEAATATLGAWAFHQNVLVVLPTGAGKTVFFAHMVSQHQGAAVVIAHRQELVEQISMALARAGVRHRIIAPDDVIRAICTQHTTELGVCFYDANAPVGVAGVDSMRSKKQLQVHGRWLKRCTLWVQDEAHHLLRENKWGKALEALDCANPAVKGLGVTAWPGRADGKGISRTCDGVFDFMHVGPRMIDMIRWGFLTDAEVVCPETDIALTEDMIGASGDYILDRGKGKAAVRASGIVGDTVANYLKWAPGKKTVVFASDVDTGADMAQRFRGAGVSAQFIDGTTPGHIRRSIMADFRAGRTTVLVNVDLFGEGFDLPAIECVILARKTKSFQIFTQQWGRGARLMIDAALMRQWDGFTVEQRLAYIAASPKPRSIIIDQVGHLVEFRAPPDSPPAFSMDRADRRSNSQSGVISTRNCSNTECLKNYRRIHYKCPYCGTVPPVSDAGRSTPKQVDGDLAMLPPEVLDQMRAAVAQAVLRSDADVRVEMLHKFASDIAVKGAITRNQQHQAAHRELLDAMAWWAGQQGLTDVREIQRLFWFKFGVDMLTPQAYRRPEMEAFTVRVIDDLTDETKLAKLQAAA